MNTSFWLFILILYKGNCYVIDIKPVERNFNSSTTRSIDDLRILGKKKVPSVLMYIGNPPQGIILGITVENNKSWVMVKKGKNFIFDDTQSNSFEKDIKFYTFVYEDKYYIGELSYDYVKIDKNVNIEGKEKFQFLKYDLYDEHQLNLNEIKGEIGLNIKAKEDNDFDPSHRPNEQESLSSSLFIDYLKLTSQIKTSRIGITFDDNGGSLYIDEELNMKKHCNINNKNTLSCELNLVKFGNNITYSQSESTVEFDMKNSYILAPGNVGTMLLVAIAIHIKKYFCIDHELYGYYYITCKGDKLSEIYGLYPSVDFHLMADRVINVLSIPTKDLFVCDTVNNECVFQIIGNVYYLEQKWIFGTVIYNSNVIQIDYDNNKIFFSSKNELNIQMNKNRTTILITINSISLFLLIGIALTIYSKKTI